MRFITIAMHIQFEILNTHMKETYFGTSQGKKKIASELSGTIFP